MTCQRQVHRTAEACQQHSSGLPSGFVALAADGPHDDGAFDGLERQRSQLRFFRIDLRLPLCKGDAEAMTWIGLAGR